MTSANDINPNPVNPDEEFKDLTPARFQEILPELMEAADGRLSTDPRLTDFLAANPDCAALLSDLETIAEHARSLFEQTDAEPADDVWSGIASKLNLEPEGGA